MRATAHVLPIAILVLPLWGAHPAHAEDGGTEPPDAATSPEPLKNEPPVPIITATGSAGVCDNPCPELESDLGVLVQLDAGRSRDNEQDSSTLTYLWELAELPPGSATTLSSQTTSTSSLTPDLVGEYVVVLTVQDREGETRRATLPIHVRSIPFRLSLVMSADDDEMECDPTCPYQKVLIGTKVTADASASQNDPAHGDKRFSWTLFSPPGSKSRLDYKNDEQSRVSFLPDVDGAYEIHVKFEDDQDSAQAYASFVIPTAVHWKPLECSASEVGEGLPWGLLLLAGLGRMRRRW